jgi:hypothetical protein
LYVLMIGLTTRSPSTLYVIMIDLTIRSPSPLYVIITGQRGW